VRKSLYCYIGERKAATAARRDRESGSGVVVLSSAKQHAARGWCWVARRRRRLQGSSKRNCVVRTGFTGGRGSSTTDGRVVRRAAARVGEKKRQLSEVVRGSEEAAYWHAARPSR
jgi:hypothetical protein